MDGRGRRHDNIFVERLWWTVKHEWVYLRPAADGIEQKRSLGEFFDWYNMRRPHQALGWRTPDEAYLGHVLLTAATAPAAVANAEVARRIGGQTGSCRADPRLTAPARSPMDKPGKTPCVSPTLPTGRRLPTSFTAPRNKTG